MQGLRGLKGDTGPQGPKGDKGDFGSDGKTTMATDLNIANNRVIHLATPIDANDALNKSYVDKHTNSLLKTDETRPLSAVFSMSNKN